jgi:hypothetical protein
MTIVQDLEHIGAALAHLIEPLLRERAQYRRPRLEPSLDCRMRPSATFEGKQASVGHGCS